ncbi:MAG: VacJ family lipoprotein [Rhodospirillales bacterium]
MASRQPVSAVMRLKSGLEVALPGALLTGFFIGLLMGPAVSTAIADEAPGATSGVANASTGNDDPLEGVNRFTAGFNRALRDAVIDPLVDGYQYVTPDPVQQSITNIFSNLTEPVTAVSSLLQGDTDNAGAATNRFIVNTTIGLGGINDRATEIGIEQRREDLGQAMAKGGVASGPHLVLPILGPTNFRDVTGDLLTGLASPLPLAMQAAGNGVRYSNYQDDIQSLSQNAVDPYSAERAAYEQHRDYAVSNGVLPDSNFPTLVEDQRPSVATTPR